MSKRKEEVDVEFNFDCWFDIVIGAMLFATVFNIFRD